MLFLLVLTVVSLRGSVTAQGEGDLRLVGGATITSGRIEIYHNGQWGTVCNDHFGTRDATVVCNQLGHVGLRPIVWRDPPPGTGLILLDDLGCKGWEARLTDCRHQPWGRHNCDHRDDAGVECDTQSFADELRLTGGTERSGRLEANYGGTWGPVCSAQFNDNAAQVACRTLGFDREGAMRTTIYGPGTGEALLAHVRCQGDEFLLSECSYTGPFDADRYCGSSGAHVGLNCLDDTPLDVSNVTARLFGGSAVSGRLELSVSGVWGTVCSDGFDNNAARVACRMLGLPTEHSVAYPFSLTHQDLPIVNIWLDDVSCTGTEDSLVTCGHRDWREHNCQHSDDIGVFCTNDPHAGHHHEIRLAGSNMPGRGRVEVEYYGIWGTVCDDKWRDDNTEVICRSLNLPLENARRIDVEQFGPREGPTWLDDVQCGGDELSIFDCTHAQLGLENCGHNEDVAVICE